VIGQPHVSAALLQGKEPTIAAEQEAGLVLETVWTFWEGDKFLSLFLIETWILQLVAQFIY
jgi:hypothetical protein